VCIIFSYIETHNMIRSITGVGGNNGPYISMHDGFLGLPQWAGYLAGSDRVILDTHPYFAFGGGTAIQPISTGTGPGAGGIWPAQACAAWGNPMNVSQTAFGVTVAGEFSNGFNDCGLYLHGVGGVPTYGGNCDDWTDASNWNASTKAGIQAFAMASMDALQNWFFWTWKVRFFGVSFFSVVFVAYAPL
jgi:glucan 1,3-beta-glucosidase